ncbi:PAS-domain containing protein [Nioella aestuarii]|uniref:PAS-domain containing protein n=1 Tax=Nioella aestuarii TaxID=1662864 RepID=UPI003D7FEC24
MTLTDPTIILFLVGISLAAGGFSAVLGMSLSRGSGGFRHVMLRGLDLPRSYVFRDGYLLSDFDGTDAMLTDPADRVGAWTELSESLSALNPDVAKKMEALRDRGDGFVLIGRIGGDELSISGRRSEGRCLITVASLDPGRDRKMIDQAGLNALEAELDLLRHGLDASDTLLWQEDSEGQIIWANRAYFDILQDREDAAGALVWPIQKLFSPDEPLTEGQGRRMPLEGRITLWFDVTARTYRSGTLYAAQPINRVVAAETSLRDFVQTLSRTFAHLPIGLAIFDKNRQLVLFNPALMSLSTLSAEWLSARPDLFAFLDKLREKQRMPEPKDYQAWRAGLGELEQAARDGTYQEMWNLPNGQTFRVIGRPHADGAVAFLFEDISQEVTLTRKFRGDLDLYQSVLDDNAEALAVFSRDGRFVMGNRAYAELWPDPVATVSEATGHWQSACAPTPLWGEIRDFVGGYADRTAWTDRVALPEGGYLICRIAPLKGGASLVGFVRETASGTLPVPVADMEEAEEPQAALISSS